MCQSRRAQHVNVQREDFNACGANLTLPLGHFLQFRHAQRHTRREAGVGEGVATHVPQQSVSMSKVLYSHSHVLGRLWLERFLKSDAMAS